MKKIKICGLFRKEDIIAANRSRPDYVGVVTDFPKSHRSVPHDSVAGLLAGLNAGITPVGVFVDEDMEIIAELAKSGAISVAQLHGSEDNGYIERLRGLLPKETTIWQAVQVKGEADIEKANGSAADFVILDAGQGAGECFDWSILSQMDREYGLAGGIDLGNIDKALTTGASLLDISGGAETERQKDAAKMEKLVKAVREGRKG